MRTKYSIRNFIVQFLTNVVTICVVFISQTVFIKILGVEYNGINGLFSNVLTILNLFELGIGSSITYNLYKYVKYDNKNAIKSIMQFYNKSYRFIAIFVFFIGLLIIPFLKLIVANITIDVNLYVIYMLFLISTVATYILSYKRSLIIANQKNYIINVVEIVYVFILNVTQIFILISTKNYYLYLSIKILFVILENVYINYKANKMFPFLKDKNILPIDNSIKKSIIDRVKALIIHKTSAAVTHGTDNILISAFLGITTTGIYTAYNYIFSSVRKLFGNIISTSTSSVGNLLIEGKEENNYKVFKRIRFLNFWISIFTATSLLNITQPFITLWIGNKYLLHDYVLIVLVINFFQTSMRSVYSTFKDAAGIWIEDKYIPLFQLFINLVSSIILVKLIGISGIFLGTILSSFVLWFYSYPVFVYKRLFKRSIKCYYIEFAKHLLVFIIVISFSFLLNSVYLNIFISITISILIPNICLLIIYHKNEDFKYYVSLFKKIIKNK